jgi:hypothetical protein
MSKLGFFPCKVEPENTYEYIAVYVDDQAIAMKKPKAFVDVLEQTYKFKKRNWPYHLSSWYGLRQG